jgi:DNA mismatch repair protein MutL
MGSISAPASFSRRIRILPEFLINQIKAGEVIERPAALLKELLENAVDADASTIEIHLKNGGLDLIHVADDGWGMFFEDLPLAFARHATSKIETFDDLYRLHSYGFRGEALASAASIARIECLSCPRDNPQLGGKVVIHGGQIITHIQHPGTAPGTALWVRDLFYNTPARLKFIKSTQAEKNSLKKVIIAFLLAYPQITFQIRWDEKDKEFYPALTEPVLAERAKKIFSSFEDDAHFSFQGEYDQHRAWGIISRYPQKGTHKNQFLFCNKRIFYDKAIHQIISQTMNPWWHGESGDYYLFLAIPPDQLDVNVHPNKTMVKFYQSSVVYSLISSCIQEKFKARTTPLAEDAKSELFSPNFSAEKTETTEGKKEFKSHQPTWSFSGVQSFFDLHYPIQDQYTLFALRKDPAELYLTQTGQLLLFFWKSLFQKSPHPEELVPLLIARPYPLPAEDKEILLSGLRENGWEFDRLNPEQIILRSAPNYLSEFPLIPLADQLVEHLTRHPLCPLEEWWEKFWRQSVLDAIPLTAPQLEKIITSLSLEFLIAEKLVRPLDLRTLADFFNRTPR